MSPSGEQDNFADLAAKSAEDPQAILRPTSALGVVAATLALTAALSAVTVFVENADDIVASLALSALFSLPFALVVRAGHLGQRRWEVPTPGAFIFLFWLIGILPSLVWLSAESRYVSHFSDAAVLQGRASAFAWFILFALSLGRPAARPGQSDGSKESMPAPFIILVVFWGFSAMLAARFDMLSYWRGSEDTLLPATGGMEKSIIGYYITLTPMMMPLAVWARQRESRILQIVGALVLVIGAAALFVCSSRRLWIVSLYLCVCTAYSFRRRPARRLILTALAVGLIGAGPLVWAFRGLRTQEGNGNPFDQAWRSVASYATSEDVREEASTASSENLRVRMGISSILFGVTDNAMVNGPNLSPSPLEVFVRSIPTFVWPEKNATAESLSAEYQLLHTGLFPRMDIAVCPITEFIFQLGPIVAPIGGILYGLGARLLNVSRYSSIRSLPRFIVWMGGFIAMSYFDGGTIALTLLREPLVAAFVLAAMGALFRRDRRNYSGDST